MDYLKKYNLTDEDLQEIYENLSYENWSNITGSSTKVKGVLDYLASIGITNFKDIFLYKPSVFYLYAEDIKKYIEECEYPDIIEKLKEDIYNFELFGL